MVDVDSMSDAELRAKLVEFGFPTMPISGTTRKTIVRKLKMLIENKNKTSGKDRRSLGRYSSEDESDNEVKATRRAVNKRATMAAPPMRPPSPNLTSKLTSRKTTTSKNSDPEPVKREVKTTTTTLRTTKILQASRDNNDEFDTGSESDEVAERFPVSPQYSYVPSSVKTPSPGRLPSSFLSASTAADQASERLNQIKSRLSQYNSGYDRPLYTSSPTPGDELLPDQENTPFLSNFTKRLSQLSETSPKASFEAYKSDVIKENDVNGGGASAKNYLSSYRIGGTRGRPTTYDYKSANQSIFKNNFVPFMVLVVAFLFFIIVAVVYMGIRSNTSLELSAVVPLCSASDPLTRPYVNCVREGEGSKALNLLRALEPELNKAAVRARCDQESKFYMTEDDVLTYIKSNYVIKEDAKILYDLRNLEVLSFFNPSWAVSVVQVDNDGDQKYETMRNMDQVVAGRQSKITGLITSRPNIPWTCSFYNTFSTALSVLSSILIGVLILCGANYGYKYFKLYQQKRREEEVAMVENIIDVLQSNCSDSSDNNYMVINHVRDMILPINDRKSKENVWRKAVDFINEHESRIRTEVQVVRGEPSEVWRWLGGPNLSTSKNKSWQGQAFETQKGSPNSLPCSPTPCLKIRGMVEEGERSSVQIKKAVLTKCADQCRILHCAVDLKSNCVYLKCVDTTDAAVAYRNLHGWWYAGNLVTVKYLRLERYMQRFPDSPAAGPPFLQ